MQINGAQLATAFSPKSLSLQENTRAPITIDGEAFSESLSATTDKKPPVVQQAPITVNEQQQAQFIRFFSVNEPNSPASNPEPLPQLPAPRLPKGVQQYIQVADTFNAETQQGVIDELV